MSVIVTRYHSGDQVKTNEMGRTRSTYEGEVHTGFQLGNLRDGDHLEDQGVNGRIILKWIFERLDGGGGIDWIYLTQYRDR
jgi:hypothetical protein